MSDSSQGAGHGSPSADEQSPLLGNGKTGPDHGSIERGQENDGGQEDSEDEVPIAEEPSTAKLLLVLGSIWIGCFLAALDSTIIATLSAPISSSFDSLSLLSWLASAYLIANAAIQPLSGRLTDILSRRTGLIFSNIFFALGNLICGLAQKEWQIILGRVVAGMGGGGLTAISTFVASDLVPLRRRGVWQGFGNICYGTGAGLGGIFGGWINDTWGWRTAFLIQVPLVVASGIVVAFVVKIPVKQTTESPWKRIDFLGATTLVIALVFLLVGLNSGGNQVPWTHPLVLTTIPLSFISLALFIYVEDRIASEPVIPVRLLLDRTVLSACLTNWLTTMTVYSLLFYGPIFFQIKGLTTTQAGVRLIPQALGSSLGSVGAGLIMRSTGRYALLNAAVEGIFVLACCLTTTFTLTSPAWQPFVYFTLLGFGYGGMLTVTLLALMSAVAHKHQAVITSASYAFRSTGSTIGITVASAVFQNVLKMRLWARFGDRPDAATIIGRIRDRFDEIDHLPHGWREGVMQSYMDALRSVFGTACGIAVLGAVISLAMREHVLHDNLARK
ncbi:hypothetical protein MMC16_003596 [Acarospora aff. strigata]|nr:hypothetical protein [Acarospora aff. strigata]